jgi:hypothetical protein
MEDRVETDLLEELGVEAVVVTKVSISSRDTGVTLERSVVIHTSNGSGRWGRGASLGSLVTDTDQVCDQVSVDEMVDIGRESCNDVLHVEACVQKYET